MLQVGEVCINSAAYESHAKNLELDHAGDCVSSLSLLYEYEVHLAPRGIACPVALGGGAPADEVAEVVDLIGEENDIIKLAKAFD